MHANASQLALGFIIVLGAFPGCETTDGGKQDADSEDELVNDTSSDVNPNYPNGPFGFKAATRFIGGELQWEGTGDTFPNICLPNEDGTTVCMEDLYNNPGADLFVFDFAAVWCTICRNAAGAENDFIAQMAANGWNVRWFTILEENLSFDKPALGDATDWEEIYSTNEEVIVDEDWVYRSQIKSDKWPEDPPRAYPVFYVVQPANMMIWEAFSGWSSSFVSANAIADRAARYNGYQSQPGSLE